MINLTEIFSTFLVMFAIIDITGSIPIFVSMREQGKAIKPLQATSVALLLFVAFYFVGDGLLRLFSIDSASFAVAGALVGYKDKGLTIETKDGKVYISMEDKLLFASGSWTVSPQGAEALKSLARILEDNPDLNIMVEGHTDNDAFRGSTAVKDNWDLSVMRATAIVKLLLKQGPSINPARVVAAGHAEYSPKVKNTSAANKARNRRTEIILTPQLGEVMKLVE
jgi:chemotaxis protein MotB